MSFLSLTEVKTKTVSSWSLKYLVRDIERNVAIIRTHITAGTSRMLEFITADFNDTVKLLAENKIYLLRPEVDKQIESNLWICSDKFDDILNAFKFESAGYEKREKCGAIRRFDIPYANKYIGKYIRKFFNTKIDQMVTKTLVNTPDTLKWLESILYKQKLVAVDIETTGLDPRVDKLVGVSMAWMDGTGQSAKIQGVYIPCGHTGEYSLFARKVEEQLSQAVVLSIIQKMVDQNITTIYHNAAFDVKWLMQLGIIYPKEYIFHDTMLMIKCFDERVRAGLKESSLREYRYAMTKFEDVTKNKKFNEVSLADALAYAGTDAVMTRLLFGWYKTQLEKYNTWSVYLDIEMKCVIPICQIELNGCEVDVAHFTKMQHSLALHLYKLKAEIMVATGLIDTSVEALADDLEAEEKKAIKKSAWEVDPDEEYVRSLNVASTQQIADLLFNRLNIQAKKFSKKTGIASTGTKALALIKREHPVIQKILDYRIAKKILDAYVKPLSKFINPLTGRIHTQIRQYGARSGRMSMSAPSLQVLPRSSVWDIRGGFIAGAGNVIIESDYCQMELMQVASESQDPVMMDAFRAHRQMMELLLSGAAEYSPLVKELKLKSDLHAKAAAAALHKKEEDVTKKERDEIGKTLNFLIVYGGSKMGLSEILTAKGMPTSEEEAQALIDGYFKLFAGLKKWLDMKQDLARAEGRVIHESGRVVHNPSQSQEISDGGIRTLVNSLIQGQCASMFKIALPAVYWALQELGHPGVRMINLVHDAIYIVCPNDKILIQKVLDIVRDNMEYEYKGLHFSVEQQVKKSMSKKDKVVIEGLRIA